MDSTETYSPLPGTHADDEEIKRYAGLLDSLGVGLVAFSPDATPCLYNKLASKLFGDAAVCWIDEKIQVIPDHELPVQLVLNTSKPIFDRVVALTGSGKDTDWLSVNALPVFSETGRIRRVLLTLTDISDQRNLLGEIEQLSIRDAQTGVFNKRHVMQLLENEIRRARRYGTPFTLAHLDIDLFEHFCEKYGQDIGDLVLVGVGKLLIESMREIDIAGRIGNDEFLLILPNVSLKDALVGLERLRVQIETQAFTDDYLRLTISGGIIEYTGENSEALVERSKSLLINAREAGRNRFCLDGDIL